MNLIPSSENNSLNIIGYCDLSDIEIIRLFRSKEYNKLLYISRSYMINNDWPSKINKE